MISPKPENPQNNPNRFGQRATSIVEFGPGGRYAVSAIHTRFDKVEWFVWDRDDDNEIIRQGSSYAEVIEGLDQ